MRVLFTSRKMTGAVNDLQYKWSDSEIVGQLSLVYVDYFDIKDRKVTIPPMMLIRVTSILNYVLF